VQEEGELKSPSHYGASQTLVFDDFVNVKLGLIVAVRVLPEGSRTDPGA
jgi:hypothetical protein